MANAIVIAGQSRKNILLMFGGNRCVWCHRLHQLFNENENISKFLNANYILVMVDVGKKDKNLDLNEKYGNPYSLGFPVLVVLGKEGNQIHTQETGSLEYTKEETAKKGHDPERVMNSLKTWAPNYSN
ncbi:MAG TPA: thioredoxin family protein [bacterium]